jgi:hypothetical protein
MGAQFNRVKTWSTGETLTASDLNAEFDNILTNLTPAGIDDESANTTAMQATTDPYPAASESLATTLQGEIQRLRYVIKQITGEAQWYIDPDTDLASVTAGPGSSTDNAIVRWNGTGGTAIQDSGCTIDDSNNAAIAGTLDVTSTSQLDGNLTVGDGTATGSAITIDNNDGDSMLSLKLNNASANQWDIYGDNDAGDILNIDYNSTTAASISTAGIVTATSGVSGTYFLPTADDTSAPAANYLYKANVPKAWAHMDIGANGAVTITDDHNVASASWANQTITVNIDTNMGNTTYAAVGNISNSSDDDDFVRCEAYAAANFTMIKWDISAGAVAVWVSGDDAECIVMGDQ